MADKINFQIKNFGPIENVDIDIAKMNVIGGHNGTGKSTASKLLYCYLRTLSSKRKKYAYKQVIKEIDGFFYLVFSLSSHDKRLISNTNPHIYRKIRNRTVHNVFTDNDEEVLKLFNQFKINVLYSDYAINLIAYETLMDRANQISDLLAL